MNNQWLNDLHRKMEDHEEDIPDGLWDDIKNELFSEEEKSGMIVGMMSENDEKETGKIISENRGRSLLYRISGIAAAVVMLFFTGKMLLDMNAEKKDPLITKRAQNENDNKNNDSKATESLKPSKTDIAESANTESGDQYSGQGNILPEKITVDKLFKNVFGKEIIDHNRILESTTKEKSSELLTKEQPSVYTPAPSVNENPWVEEKKKTEEIFNNTEDHLPEIYAANNPQKTSGKKPRKWMLSMLTGNVSSNSPEQKFPGYTSMSGSPMAFSDFWSATTETNPLTEVLLANQSKEVEARIRHKIPVTFGLSMYYSLGKKWGIGTGVNYTKLISELHSGSNSNYIKGEQSIHYIGIPVQVNYNIIQKGRFTGYVTGGVLAEKAVAGKLTTKYIVNDVVQETQEEKINIKPVQFSVNSAVGLQMKIIDKIGVYAEPGIGYHFKNESELNTIYKEKPLNFNMKFGIRVLLD
ncbi:PorT family protein [Chryseobacterium sp. L7]|uniref:PorT family protein n=1 Tax=Chryseobacterium endalhagicum TaxID=2797638 RepID=A0ABS1QGJ8_9FLAO|nr:outer membrane beta-barrel protein [Chryseobacterium endalhagicum]MBL1221725.1 PorT family protein [Chryseobacterium endalhagicum]